LEAKVDRHPEPSYAFEQAVSFLKLIPQAAFPRNTKLRPFETIDQYFISWVSVPLKYPWVAVPSPRGVFQLCVSTNQPGFNRHMFAQAPVGQSQLLHDLERGVQWIASALRQCDPDGRPITLEQPASGRLAMVRLPLTQ
jgi:hypothetical protein